MEINLALNDTIREFGTWHRGNIIVDTGRLEVVDIDTAVVSSDQFPIAIILVLISVAVMPLGSCSFRWGCHVGFRTAAFSA